MEDIPFNYDLARVDFTNFRHLCEEKLARIFHGRVMETLARFSYVPGEVFRKNAKKKVIFQINIESDVYVR